MTHSRERCTGTPGILEVGCGAAIGYLSSLGKEELISGGECLCVPSLAGRVPAQPPPSPGEQVLLCMKKRKSLLHLIDRRCCHTDLKLFHIYYIVYCYCSET